ncbi:innate immunity activator b isoform X2 [Pangasianodon hypophthalmus]|uniref:innate immunity activator b isoform X2 n=1 Tax=Pangasianodon hypophthalmus TaxID=310915 RepID=UPI000EFF3AF0|nr:innate immunity activator b isoform X2 [Pangasianodon hypophthalmus]
MEAKEEISDTDSGIILHSGLDSPIIVTKEVGTHTRAVKLKRQSLQDRLELCILELKKLCIREAELTGHLCSDYPLLPGEKPPQIRKRIGAAFKLDEQSILHRDEDSELCSVEAKLALQQQIYTAAHRLCHEEHLSKAVKKSRVQQCKREEQKLKELQDSLFQLRLEYGRSSPRPCIITQKHHATSDNSSLSDSAVLDEELTSQSSQASSEPPSITELHSVAPGPSLLSLNPSGPLLHPPEPRPSPHQPPLEHLHLCHGPSLEYDPAPIQNSPWKESSLDQPYQKQKKSHSSSTSSSCSPASCSTLPPLETCLEEVDLKLQIPKHTAPRHTQSSSTPSTPEMHLRRVLSLRVPSSDPANNAERDRGRSRGPRRRLTDVILKTPEYSPITLAVGNPVHHSSSEDSNSEHSSAPSYTSSPCQELLAEPEQLCQAQHRYHYSNHSSPSYVTHRYYKNSSAQLSPKLYRGYIDEGRGHDMDLSRMYIRHQPSPCINGHYEYWYEEPPLYQQGGRLIPHHLKLSRAPSLKEYPQHQSRALPRQVVSDELKSWHQRCQLRPRSLDRQGAVRIRNLPLHESPLSHHHDIYDQVPQRTADRTPVKWYEEDDQEIVSQV